MPTSGRNDCRHQEAHVPAPAREQRRHRVGRSVGPHCAGVLALFDIAGPGPGDERTMPDGVLGSAKALYLPCWRNLAGGHLTVIHLPSPDGACTGADHGRPVPSSEGDERRGAFAAPHHGCRTSSPELFAHAQVRKLPAHRRTAASSSSCPWCFRRIRSGGQGPWNRFPKPVERPSLLGSAIRAITGVRE